MHACDVQNRMMIKKTMKSSRKMVGQAIIPTAKYIFQPHKPKNLESEQLLLNGGEEMLSDGEQRRRWRSSEKAPPRGWLAVYVGPEERRYIIPTKYLRMPEFERVMERVAEEFGHQHGEGGLRIPNCGVEEFEKMMVTLDRRSRTKSNNKDKKLS